MWPGYIGVMWVINDDSVQLHCAEDGMVIWWTDAVKKAFAK